MKELAGGHGRSMGLADINRAVTNALTVARHEYRYAAEVAAHLGDIPHVVCDIGEINQVLLNLIVNASHAMTDARPGSLGRLTVRTRRAGPEVVISVADTGCGIPPEVAPRIFDPFFTTKPVGKGTGQGLAISRAIVVDHHRGQLTFETEIGAGTTFFVRLPI